MTSPSKDPTPIPVFKLYGYGNIWTATDLMYCETIAAQEKLHNWHVKLHKHMDLFQILYLKSGHAEVHLDGSSQAMNAGQMVLIPQMVVHGFQFDPGCIGYILTITYALMTQISAQTGLALTSAHTPVFLSLGADAESRHTQLSFDCLNREYHNLPSPHRGVLLESLLSCILIWSYRCSAHSAGPQIRGKEHSSKHLGLFTQLIEAHYTEHHQVAYYASRIGITPAHLNVITKMHADKSALRLIHERLLLEARRELIYTTRTINTISYSLGFADPGYFTRFFKRVAGVSPKTFRQQMGSHRAADS
ncbi:helix-turn-helix domain-containing protein [Alcaligenaceae bacterium CGII-47]|nr:helix-turn-helix domain-containing protein [Alcaligenaceae bacterium CGII-47]